MVVYIKVNIELTEVKRQSDQNLVSILNKLRLGECGERETKILAGIYLLIKKLLPITLSNSFNL